MTRRQCESWITMKGESLPCDLDEGHFGEPHKAAGVKAIWGPVPQPPLHRMAPYAAWGEYVSDDDIESIIRGRE